MPQIKEVELTNAQANQQDLIDGAITEIILSVKPNFEHDMEIIGAIRNSFINDMARILNVSVDDIYPEVPNG